MQQVLLLLCVVLILGQKITFAQELAVAARYAPGSYNKFKNSIGYEIAYSYSIKSKNRIGIAFSQSFYNKEYTYDFFSTSDGENYSREVRPKNQHLAIVVDYSFDLLNKENSHFYLGPRLGLHYLYLKEEISQTNLDNNETRQYVDQYWEVNNIGIGLLLNYERKILDDNTYIAISTEPALVILGNPYAVGPNSPWAMGLINLSIGLKYKFKNH